MKKFNVIPLLVTSLLASQALAGTLTVSGDLTVTTNLTAQSITLGGVTETNWSGAGALPLQGYKYVIASEGTNDIQRGNNLLAAYSTATTLGPTSSNRVAVIVPPGAYNLGSTSLVMNTSYVDLVGLVPAQMTSKQVFTNSVGVLSTKTIANVQCPVRIYSSASAGALLQNVDYIRIESVILTNITSGFAYSPSVSGAGTVLRHVSMSLMRDGVNYAGEYIDCVSGGAGFGGSSGENPGDASGVFIDCVGGDYSFSGYTDPGEGGSGNAASGTFINCTGGNSSFAGGENEASGTFKDCVGGSDSFAGASGIADGTFINCVGGGNSFSGYDGGVSQDSGIASGYFINCAATDASFGGNSDVSGTFINCVGGGSSFGGTGGTIDSSAKLQHCKGGGASFAGYGASDDFSYNVSGTNTFLMLPFLPTTTNGLLSGTVYNSSGTLKVIP